MPKKESLSEEQKRDIERLRHFIARGGYTSQMNSTKWRLLIDAILGIPGYIPSFRVKCLQDKDDPPGNQWDTSFPRGLPLYNSIAWIEFNPRVTDPKGPSKPAGRRGFGEAIKTSLSDAGLPFTETGSGIRVVGYTK
jgi:hypothetical protein